MLCGCRPIACRLRLAVAPCRPTRRPPIACCWRTAGPPTPSCARHSLPSSIGSPRFSRPRQKIRSSHTPSAAAPWSLARPAPEVHRHPRSPHRASRGRAGQPDQVTHPQPAAPGELSRPCRPSPPSLICSLRFLQVLWTSRLSHGQLIAAAGVHVTSLRLRQSKLPDRRYSQSYRTNKIIPLIPDLEVWPTVLAAVAAADAPSEAACRRCQMSLEECSGCIVPLT